MPTPRSPASLPVVGLYSAPAALLFYAPFDSSRHLIAGRMSATAALSAAIRVVVVADIGVVAAVAVSKLRRLLGGKLSELIEPPKELRSTIKLL